jgi:type VI secretion system protein ImpB
MPESTQHKLDRIRPPRVQITYDLELAGAIEMKQLPLVVGILTDLTGKPDEPLPPLKERKFVEIDRDNFNEVMASLRPRLAIQVDNKLTDEEGSKLNAELRFTHIDDFEPQNLIHQLEPLKKLFEARQRLNDLIAKLDGNDDLDALLTEVAGNTDGLKQLQEQTKQPEAEAS